MSDTEYSGSMPVDSVKDPSKLSDGGLYFWLKDLFEQDYDHCDPWHKQAKDDFAFKASKQWDEKGAAGIPQSPGAGPPIVFNMSLAVISAVAGIEINQRHEVVYLPRGTDEGDIKVNEILTGTSQWMGYECDAEDEESEAFEEALDCGLGCTENRMDYDTDPNGMYVEECVPIREMYWDKHARKKNLVDARRVWRARKMPLNEARDLMRSMGVDVEDGELDCTWVGSDQPGKKPQIIEERREKREKSELPDTRAEVTILHAQWIVNEIFHRVVVRGENDEHHLNDDQFKSFMQRVKSEGAEDMVTHATQRRKVYWEAFIGGSVLLKRRMEKVTRTPDGGTSIAQLDKFTYQFITGYLNKDNGHWMGLISLLRDPQKLINKSLQKMIHILSTTAQGGLLAEKGSFGSSLDQAQSTYARYDTITEVAEGALVKGKIMPKPGAGNIAPFAQLVEYAIESLWRVVGLNPEIMGMVNSEQPGILEYQRKQAAMTILAKLFDSLRRFRKNVGRVRLYYMQNFISDGRIVRINGDDGYKGIKLLRNKTVGDFDVIVDDAPTSPNQKELTFSILMQLLQLPELQARIDQDTVLMLLEYSPLPSKVVDGFRKKFSQGPTPEQQQQQQIAQQGALAKIAKDNATAKHQSAAADKAKAEAAVIAQDPTVQAAKRSEALAGVARAIHAAQQERHKATAQQMAAIGASHKARTERVKGMIAQIKGMQDLAHAEQDQASNYRGLPALPQLMPMDAPTRPTPEAGQ